MFHGTALISGTLRINQEEIAGVLVDFDRNVAGVFGQYLYFLICLKFLLVKSEKRVGCRNITKIIPV
jgi:hypothetical protein